MIVFINIVLVLIISTLTYFLFLSDSNLDKKRTKEILNLKREEEEKERKVIEVIQKIPFSKTQKELNQLGNPFRLNPISYLVVKCLIALLAFIGVMGRIDNIMLGILAMPAGFFLIDYLHYRSNKNDLDLIRLDFADVDDLLILKKKRGVVIGKALLDVHTAARKSKRLRNALIVVAAQINMTGRVNEALQNFEDKFNFKETSDFVKCIKSAQETGLIEEELEGHARGINRDKNLYMKSKTRSFSTSIMIAALLIFFGVMALILSTVLMQVSNGMNTLFS